MQRLSLHDVQQIRHNTMQFQEFGILFVWWGVWSLADRLVLPYSPVGELLFIVFGFSLSRCLARREPATASRETQTSSVPHLSVETVMNAANAANESNRRPMYHKCNSLSSWLQVYNSV